MQIELIKNLLIKYNNYNIRNSELKIEYKEILN